MSNPTSKWPEFLGSGVARAKARFATKGVPDRLDLVSLLAVQTAGSVIVLWVLAGYFNFDVFGSYVYYSNDGWCNPIQEGLGDHCFGDWNERIAPSFSDFRYPAFKTNMEVSPIGPYWTSFFNLIEQFTTARTALIVALLVAMLCSWWAVVILVSDSRKRMLALALGLVCTTPVLVAWDRLHLFAFCLPIFAYLVRAAVTRDEPSLAKAILALSVVRPHFALLYVVFVASRQWKTLIFYSTGSVISVLCLLVLPSSSAKNRLTDYVQNVLDMSDYRPSGLTSYPTNISIRRVLEIFSGLFEYTVSIDRLLLISLLFSVTLLILTALRMESNYLFLLLVLLPVVCFGLNGFVPPYYLVFSSVIGVYLLGFSPLINEVIRSSVCNSTIGYSLLIAAIVTSQSLTIIPYGVTPWNGLLNATPILGSALWVTLSVVLTAQGAKSSFRSRLRSRALNDQSDLLAKN